MRSLAGGQQSRVPPDDLEQLIEYARAGDADAFGTIYDRFRDELLRYLYLRTRDREQAEDLTQQVFIKVWRNLRRYEHRGYFKAWLYRVARNMVVDHYRARRSTLDIDGVEVGEPAEAERRLIEEETHRDLRRAIERLPEDYREVLTLRFMMGLSAAEAGERMHRSAVAVRALQVRALCALRDQFDGQGDLT